MSTIKKSNTKRFRTRERQQTVVFFLHAAATRWLLVCGRSLLSLHHWLKLAWPTLLPRSTQTPTMPLSSSVSDMHFVNLSAPFSLPDMNSVTALSLNTSTHTWLHPLRTFLPCNYSRRFPFLDVHAHTHMHSCLQKAVFFQWFPRLTLPRILAAPWEASRLWVFSSPHNFFLWRNSLTFWEMLRIKWDDWCYSCMHGMYGPGNSRQTQSDIVKNRITHISRNFKLSHQTLLFPSLNFSPLTYFASLKFLSIVKCFHSTL